MQQRYRHLALIGVSLLAWSCFAQRVPFPENMSSASTLVSPKGLPTLALQPVMITPAVEPCTRFVEPFDVDDYSGPMNRLVARISQRLNGDTVRVPRHHAPKPCALDAHDKFRIFLSNTADPLSFVGAAWDAGTAQLDHDDPAYRQGAAGYGKRYSAAVTDNVSGEFFSTFLYPSLFHQDPRYYRLAQGPVKARLGHALAHRFVAQSDSGKRMPNYSEWFGTASAKALSNLYHPGNPRGFGPTASRVGFSVANDMAWDVLREFWPEIAHKFHLPFRTHADQVAARTPAPVALPLRAPPRQSALQVSPDEPPSPFITTELLEAAR